MGSTGRPWRPTRSSSRSLDPRGWPKTSFFTGNAVTLLTVSTEWSLQLVSDLDIAFSSRQLWAIPFTLQRCYVCEACAAGALWDLLSALGEDTKARTTGATDWGPARPGGGLRVLRQVRRAGMERKTLWLYTWGHLSKALGKRVLLCNVEGNWFQIVWMIHEISESCFKLKTQPKTFCLLDTPLLLNQVHCCQELFADICLYCVHITCLETSRISSHFCRFECFFFLLSYSSCMLTKAWKLFISSMLP